MLDNAFIACPFYPVQLPAQRTLQGCLACPADFSFSGGRTAGTGQWTRHPRKPHCSALPGYPALWFTLVYSPLPDAATACAVLYSLFRGACFRARHACVPGGLLGAMLLPSTLLLSQNGRLGRDVLGGIVTNMAAAARGGADGRRHCGCMRQTLIVPFVRCRRLVATCLRTTALRCGARRRGAAPCLSPSAAVTARRFGATR